MAKIYCILGFSCTGKSTIEKLLTETNQLQRVITTTSRPMRKGEFNGVDYNYISKEEFLIKKDLGKFIETAEYRGWFYGTPKEAIDLSNKKDYIIVVEPKGFYKMKELYGDSVVGIYLYLQNHWELLMRGLNRQPHADKDACKEICRRYLSDFETFSEVEKKCILKINNIDAQETTQIILRNIKNGL